MNYLAFFGLLIACECQAQIDQRNLLGVYASDRNSEEQSSLLELRKNYRFIYKYRLGACEGEVRGVWGKVQGKLKLKNDVEFLNKGSIQYPDLSLVTWSINKNGIKPDDPFYACGFIEKSLHRKIKMN